MKNFFFLEQPPTHSCSPSTDHPQPSLPLFVTQPYISLPWYLFCWSKPFLHCTASHHSLTHSLLSLPSPPPFTATQFITISPPTLLQPSPTLLYFLSPHHLLFTFLHAEDMLWHFIDYRQPSCFIHSLPSRSCLSLTPTYPWISLTTTNPFLSPQSHWTLPPWYYAWNFLSLVLVLHKYPNNICKVVGLKNGQQAIETMLKLKCWDMMWSSSPLDPIGLTNPCQHV